MSDYRMYSMQLGMVMTNCYLVWNDDTREAFVVDPADRADLIAMKIRREGLILKAILLTHGHFDHMMAVPDLKNMFDVPVYAGEAEKPVLLDAGANLSEGWGGKAVEFDADHYLKDGEVFRVADFEITTIATPGHTVGGVCYYLKDEGQLFAGDTLFRGSYGRTDLETGNTLALMKSIREKLLVLPSETYVYPGHDAATSIEFERRRNPAARGMI
ncbi:MAG: MBL fold metallo-hydrolase [Lachnospiraceae bacterium]|nr:MBL fold metallo-hydrolase [Lachnospiraceae bacterium]